MTAPAAGCAISSATSLTHNVFVLGLDEFQRGELQTVTNADGLAFHRLLDKSTLIDPEGYRFGDLLSLARRERDAFEGSVDAIIAHWDLRRRRSSTCRCNSTPTSSTGIGATPVSIPRAGTVPAPAGPSDLGTPTRRRGHATRRDRSGRCGRAADPAGRGPPLDGHASGAPGTLTSVTMEA